MKHLPASCVAEGAQADVIMANNVMAHVPDLGGFLAVSSAARRRRRRS